VVARSYWISTVQNNFAADSHPVLRRKVGNPGNANVLSAKKQNFLDGVSNSNPAVRLYREGRATGPPEDRYRMKEKS
jgi:hypothetical protein